MHVSQINIYPIKSLKGIGLQEAVVEERGPQHDRRWMLVGPDNKFLTQREHPRMATISVAVTREGLFVKRASAELAIPLMPEIRRAFVQIWTSHIEAFEYDERVNRWFSEQIGTNCRLVVMPKEAKRKVDPQYAVHLEDDVVSFADGYPFLLIGEGSLDELNSRLTTPLPMNRFRPNFVVKGSEPFAEDKWRAIRIGETVFHVVKPCARCTITTVDQAAGVFAGKEPLKTLATFRNVNGKVMFGQNLIAENAGGTIRVGDEIEVLEVLPARSPA